MHGNDAASLDGAVSFANKSTDNVIGWIGAVVKVHVLVLDAGLHKGSTVVQGIVQSHDERDLMVLKVLDGLAQGRADRHALCHASCSMGALGRQRGHISSVFGTGKRQKVGRDPVPIAIMHLLIVFIRLQVKGSQVKQVMIQGAAHAIQDILDRKTVVCPAVSCITERLELHFAEWVKCIGWRNVVDGHRIHRTKKRSICLVVRVHTRVQNEVRAVHVGVHEHLVDMDAEAIEHGNVQRTPVV